MRLLLFILAVPLLAPASAVASLPAPRLVGPRNGGWFQQLPAISWTPVRHAAEYEYEISGDPQFHSILGSGPGKGTNRTYNLAGALDKAVPDGTYWWRVRALTAKGSTGRWSSSRRIVKRWTIAPGIRSGDGSSISWPATPLVLSWSSVPYAVKYAVTIATDPALSNPVLGSPSQPQYTDGTSFVLPTTLASGAYYWAITPVDAEGHRGTRSRIGSFAWTWPTSTAVSFANLSSDPGVFDPLFSWNPVPGAARYDVEINQHPDFPPGSKWCCSAPTIGTSLAPQQNLANNSTYWWRVRAIDGNGHAGQWNYGASFTKAFDALTPTVPNLKVVDEAGQPLKVVDASGQPVIPTTDTPIVTWGPVPGASRYEVTVGAWTGTYCNWAASSQYHAETATTSWTPLGNPGISKPTSSAWPSPQIDAKPLTPGTWCIRVVARSDDDAQHQQVVSVPSYANPANDPNTPAFAWVPSQSSATSQPFQPFVSSSSDYILPASGSLTRLPPLLTWKWLPGATGFFVVIARDPGFTDVADVAYTTIPAYAPRLGNAEPLADKDTAYYWAIIPAGFSSGMWGFSDAVLSDTPQTFNKSSIPPSVLAPANGANVSTWPTFEWTGVDNARNYTLQVSQDPSFGSPIDNITTDATGYTSSSTYPADTLLYWRVRGNDWTGQGLNWSPVQTFTRRLPASAAAPGNPTGGELEPVLSWAPVPGATSYDIHVEQGNGTSNDYTVDSTSFAPVSHQGIGTVRWQVRPLFPTTAFTPVGGGFFAPQPYLLKLGPPNGARGVKSGSRLVISWNPDPAAKQYEVDVATTDSFSSMIDFHRVDGTTWAPDINWSLPADRGRLYWRVAAIGSDGITVGSFSTGSFLNGRSAPKHRAKQKHRRGRHG